MSAKTLALMALSEPGLYVSAPSTCPVFPGLAAASTTPASALIATASLPVLLAQPHSFAPTRATARLSQIRTRASRGPPAYPLG